MHSPLRLFSDRLHQVYYAYLCYLLSLDYLSLQQLWYYFLNCVYPNPPCQLSLWEETRAPGENPRLSAERWQTLFRGENRTHDLRGERLKRGLLCRLRHQSRFISQTQFIWKSASNRCLDKLPITASINSTFALMQLSKGQKCPFVMKSALFVQANVAVNTIILTSMVPFLFPEHIYECSFTQASYVILFCVMYIK